MESYCIIGSEFKCVFARSYNFKMEKGKSQEGGELTSEEMAALISILAREYKTTASAVLQKLDLVSGDLDSLNKLLGGDHSVKWTADEDDLLNKNPELLKKWKGNNQVELRKKYLNFKVK